MTARQNGSDSKRQPDRSRRSTDVQPASVKPVRAVQPATDRDEREAQATAGSSSMGQLRSVSDFKAVAVCKTASSPVSVMGDDDTSSAVSVASSNERARAVNSRTASLHPASDKVVSLWHSFNVHEASAGTSDARVASRSVSLGLRMRTSKPAPSAPPPAAAAASARQGPRPIRMHPGAKLRRHNRVKCGISRSTGPAPGPPGRAAKCAPATQPSAPLVAAHAITQSASDTSANVVACRINKPTTLAVSSQRNTSP
mmetsp:Transcript_11342/g.39527  ORF Transcript_11342/g.39527 Transcript_11342/m.39527 type:complete len:256 (-) Transcript_11342:393-1160(-)